MNSSFIISVPNVLQVNFHGFYIARKKYKGVQRILEISDSDHLLFSMTRACPAALCHRPLWLRLQAWHLQPSKRRAPPAKGPALSAGLSQVPAGPLRRPTCEEVCKGPRALSGVC